MAQNLSTSEFAQYAHGHKQSPDATLRRPQALRIMINNGFAMMVTTVINRSIVGRKDVNVDVDVDLNRYGAMQLGISRKHLAFIQHNGGMMVMDLGSRNGSWINGERMQPSQYYDLNDGDVLRLGRMKMDIEFVELQVLAQSKSDSDAEATHPTGKFARETLEVSTTIVTRDAQNIPMS